MDTEKPHPPKQPGYLGTEPPFFSVPETHFSAQDATEDKVTTSVWVDGVTKCCKTSVARRQEPKTSKASRVGPTTTFFSDLFLGYTSRLLKTLEEKMCMSPL